MIIQLDLNSETPLYQQLHDQLILGIASGGLKSGESLPSVRQLGSDLGINLHTVNKVYTMLRQEGFLSVHRQKGVVVNPPEEYQAAPGYLTQVGDLLKPVIAEAYCRGIPLDSLLAIVTERYLQFDGTSARTGPSPHQPGAEANSLPKQERE